MYGKNFEQLLRWVFDKPFNVKPELGKKPAFLDEKTGVSLGTSVFFRRLIEAVKNTRPHSSGTLTEYFNFFSEKMCKFRLTPSNGATDFDEQIIESIGQFVPARSELIEVFASIAQYDNKSFTASVIHKFFEFANEAVAHFKLTDQSARLQSEYSTSPPLIPSNLDDDEMDEQLKNATNAMFSISNDDHDTNFQTNSKMFFIPKCRNINTSQKKKIVATY